MSTHLSINEHQGTHQGDSRHEKSKHESKHESGHERAHETTSNTANTKNGPNVVVERHVNPPVVIEHHHEQVDTVIHPTVIREHETTEIRQVIKPVHEKVQGENKSVYAGEHIQHVKKSESDEAARNKVRANQAAVAGEAVVTHSRDESVTMAPTKTKDVHGQHKIIEEVTPVIYRDVEHNKTIHKEEKVIEKIHHAPDVHVKDKRRVEEGSHHKHHHKHQTE